MKNISIVITMTLMLLSLCACDSMYKRNYKKAEATLERINRPLSDAEKKWMNITAKRISDVVPKEVDGYKLTDTTSIMPQAVKLERTLVNSSLTMRMVYKDNLQQSLVLYMFVNPVRPIVDELAFCSFKSFRYEQQPSFIRKHQSSYCWRPKILIPIQANLSAEDGELVGKEETIEGFMGEWLLEEKKPEWAKLTLMFHESIFRSKVYGIWYVLLGKESAPASELAEAIDQRFNGFFP